MERLTSIARIALKNAFKEYSEKTPVEAFDDLTTPILTPATNPKFGHYYLNNTMKAYKLLYAHGIYVSPKELSESIKSAIIEADTDKLFDNVTVAAVFVNLTLSLPFLLREACSIFLTTPEALPRPPIVSSKQRIIVDFSSPNVAKSMHVGHLRSTIIGDTICRLFEYLGHSVDRVNHLGDWGTQFGMLIAHLIDLNLTDTASTLPISDLVEFYKESKVKFDADEDFKKRAQLEVVKLQRGDNLEKYLWRKLVDLSLREFYQIYDRLNIKIEPFGESFYNEFLPGIVYFFVDNGIAEESDGALIIQVDGSAYPLIIRKRDGGYNYDTTDLATIRYRSQDLKGDRLIYVTDLGQASHFDLIFKTAIRVGWTRPGQAEHVGFGVVLGEDGKRLKTRSGETVKLVELLDEAVFYAKKILYEGDKYYTEEEAEHIACAVGIGAVKYADLSSMRTKDYRFDYKKMLSFKGNTASYMLYSFARISSIVRKLGIDRADIYKPDFVGECANFGAEEVALLVYLLKCHDVLISTATDLMPHRICDYMYYTCICYTNFYENCRVIGEDGSADHGRLALCEMTRQALRLCFNILNIQEIDRM